MFLKMALLIRAEFFIIVESTFSPVEDFYFNTQMKAFGTLKEGPGMMFVS